MAYKMFWEKLEDDEIKNMSVAYAHDIVYEDFELNWLLNPANILTCIDRRVLDGSDGQ